MGYLGRAGLGWAAEEVAAERIGPRLGGQAARAVLRKDRGSKGNHMKVVAATESRVGTRDLYVPLPKGAMAHRSFPSPDGRWAVVVEMNDRGDWLPCRVVPMDGSSTGRQVGPPGAPCWFAAGRPMGSGCISTPRGRDVSDPAAAFFRAWDAQPHPSRSLGANGTRRHLDDDGWSCFCYGYGTQAELDLAGGVPAKATEFTGRPRRTRHVQA